MNTDGVTPATAPLISRGVKPFELFLTKGAQAALLDICHIDQPNEVDTFLVETGPASHRRIFPESFPV
jgi:hypothetical protein